MDTFFTDLINRLVNNDSTLPIKRVGIRKSQQTLKKDSNAPSSYTFFMRSNMKKYVDACVEAIRIDQLEHESGGNMTVYQIVANCLQKQGLPSGFPAVSTIAHDVVRKKPVDLEGKLMRCALKKTSGITCNDPWMYGGANLDDKRST